VCPEAARYPEEKIDDPHFQARGTLQLINHPEIGRALHSPVSVGTDGRLSA
jgi:hypothetical protein